MSGRLEGKVAVVTGAASGIGRGTVELFVREGAKVVGADLQDDKGARMAEELGDAFRYIRCDVTDEAQVKAAIDLAVSEFGKLDILFNNAGTGGALENIENVTGESFDSVMHLHVLAALYGIKHALPHMKANGGSIISTASIAGMQNGFGPILYSVAKAGIIHMTKLAAVQAAPFRVRVNCICPGLIATPIFGTSMGMARPKSSMKSPARTLPGGRSVTSKWVRSMVTRPISGTLRPCSTPLAPAMPPARNGTPEPERLRI